ncbi:MAG: alpha/beta hydrolase [Myxococcales bacterium]|nr:alpha/beta hydrolase [Myxococcales bacterium]
MPTLQFTDANGLRFAYFEEGEGPLVLLLHGFPDTAHTWDAVRPALAAAGYRAVSPFLRGYHPTAIPGDGKYDAETLGRDTLALIEALGEERAIVVGHDWGAVAAYAAAAIAPERVSVLVTVAVPHGASLRPTPRLLWGVRHFFRLKTAGAPAFLRANDFAYIDALVHRWSPAWQVPPGETSAVKEALAHPGSAEAAIGYYRAIPLRPPPCLARRTTVPSAVFSGENDGILGLADYERARRCYTGRHEIVHMPGGHFLHREHPARFIAELLRVIADLLPT